MAHRVAMLVALLVLAAGASSAVAAPPCFGAAAHDPEHPCSNPALRHKVTPHPDDAVLMTDAPCDPVGESTELCTFGVPAASSSATIALFGDSHARHYRATVGAVAAAHRFHGISLTRPSCPFSLAPLDAHEPVPSHCAAFNRGVIRYAADHPEIDTVFVSESREKVVAMAGADPVEQQIQGYVAAWDALPASVTHVVVIRDPFYDRVGTPDCVTRALRHKQDPARACALPRARVLKADPAIAAAGRPHRSGLRVDTIDLTPFFCGAKRCFPVIGGVLVHKDVGHITQTFAATLGPYLLRAFDRLPG
jgi:hypothetical protein